MHIQGQTLNTQCFEGDVVDMMVGAGINRLWPLWFLTFLGNLTRCDLS